MERTIKKNEKRPRKTTPKALVQYAG